MEEIMRQMQLMLENQERIMKENRELKTMLSILLNKEGQFNDVMDTGECARYLNITPQRVRALTAAREIPFFKNEGSTRNFYRREDLDQWRASRRVKTNAELRTEVATKSAISRMRAV